VLECPSEQSAVEKFEIFFGENAVCHNQRESRRDDENDASRSLLVKEVAQDGTRTV